MGTLHVCCLSLLSNSSIQRELTINQALSSLGTHILAHYLFRVQPQMPKMQLRSNAKPSVYAYPEPLKPPKKEEKEKVGCGQLFALDHIQSFVSLKASNT